MEYDKTGHIIKVRLDSIQTDKLAKLANGQSLTNFLTNVVQELLNNNALGANHEHNTNRK
jgi:hypothetical protein